VSGTHEGGVNLPTLSNEGSAADLLSGKQLIDGEGNVVTGTIETKTSSNLTASGATVTVPAGYYASQATKSIASVPQGLPSIYVDSSGKIIASMVLNEGYVTSSTKSATKRLTTQAAKTITPSTSSQTAVASGVYTTGAVTVAAIPSNYEDVTTETTAYTNELADLVSQISALESALEGKASGGGSGNVNQQENVNVNLVVQSSASSYIPFCTYLNWDNGELLPVIHIIDSTNHSLPITVAKNSLIHFKNKSINTEISIVSATNGIEKYIPPYSGTHYGTSMLYVRINNSGNLTISSQYTMGAGGGSN
jgi:hypothetical protein